MLLCEYAIIPDIFDSSSYDHELVADAQLQSLKEALLAEGLVRDLREGDWSRILFENSRQNHRRGLELLKKLKLQNRLLTARKELADAPSSNADWCNEALASHQASDFTGIITTRETAAYFANSTAARLIGVIGRLNTSAWWQARDCSVRLRRTIDDYRTHLKLILRNSNSLMFIDPYLDPNKRHYQDFIQLLTETRLGGKSPQIEIHRACYEGSGRNRQVYPVTEWETLFRHSLAGYLSKLGMNIQVFIWDDLHDRYLLSNLLGIHLGNGFDVSENPDELTTWSRLGRSAQDNIQLEFDEAANQVHKLHRLRGKFLVP